MSKICLPEQAKMIEALEPAADAAGRTGAYVSLKNAGRAFVVVHIDQGNAATVALTVEQATAVAGTGSKALTNNAPIWANQDCAAGDTLVRQTDAKSFTTSAAVKHKMVVFQIDPASLDVANGFDCITVKSGASNEANITQALYILTDLRYAQATPPSAIED
ncbi:MAG: hypothetical protein KKB20_08180 [Proteobacteria bacterium]|nr:hypothetical protein [Pseudomonadota bacterium]